MRLIGALGAHDRRTRGHCERVRVLTDLLAAEMHLGQDDREPPAVGRAAARPGQARGLGHGAEQAQRAVGR
jgi:HD-GYP domain-containing protein (c-di-GMP phosphodiesterase class II)